MSRCRPTEKRVWMIDRNFDLSCPCARKCTLTKTDAGYICDGEGCPHGDEKEAFVIVDDVPVLISDLTCDTVCEARSVKPYIPRAPSRLAPIKKLLLGQSSATRRNCEAFVAEVKLLSAQPKILVIGAGEKGSATDALWTDKDLTIHGADVYHSPSVDIVCDGHYLPFASGQYHGVWIQAVLEHVVDPTLVVSEIHRVLAEGGIVYAETPFMQQVHEGAYDFTRYSVLGHRYLFRDFALLDMGGLNGTEVVLSWSLRYFAWALTRSRKIGGAVALLSGALLRPFGYLTSKESLFDAASGVFFLGRKSDRVEVSHKSLITLYKGQFKH